MQGHIAIFGAGQIEDFRGAEGFTFQLKLGCQLGAPKFAHAFESLDWTPLVTHFESHRSVSIEWPEHAVGRIENA